MYNKKINMAKIIACAITLCMNFMVYGNDILSSFQPTPETDFNASINMEGTGVDIRGYTGDDSVIYVPATIQGFPVKSVRLAVNGDVRTLIISEGCEEVRIARATPLYDFPTNITTVYLPDSIVNFDLSNTQITEFEVPANPQIYGDLPETVKEVRFRGVPETIWTSAFYGAQITELVIPEGVKRIELMAFQGCESLKTIVLPQSLTHIDDSAFAGCTSLESIIIPDSVTRIDEDAFAYCTSLKSANLPTSLEHLGVHAFRNCSNLTDLHIPDSLSSFEMYDAFEECSKLPFATQAHLRRLGYEYSF